MWAFATVVVAPTVASAQQGGLFPLHPIKRQRVPCPMEDPVYKLYRHEYFGYHPTCWRRFPPGWGCPSAEAPNAAQAFRDRPRDPAPELPYGPEEEMGPPGGPDMGPEGPGVPPRGPNIPPLPPSERSPFDLDTPMETRPRGNAPPPRTLPEAGPDEAAPPLRPNRPAPPPGESSDASAAAPGSMTVAPEGEVAPPPLVGLPDPGGAAEEAMPALPPVGPEVVGPGSSASSAPSLSAPTVAPPGPTSSAAPAPPAMSPSPAPTMAPAPAQAPRRTSLIGSLLGGIGLRRR